MSISRREALHRLSVIAGGAISAPAMSAILSGCRPEPASMTWAPRVLTADQAELLGTLVDLIIPATDTPGAREAGVPGFIDKMLADWVEPDERDRFVAGLDALDLQMNESDGVSFNEATADQRTAFLSRLDLEALQARGMRVDPLPFFASLKEWTLVGYYTSEVGATQELQWLATPGRYDGDVSVEEVGRTWA